jgi:hypothetical protein
MRAPHAHARLHASGASCRSCESPLPACVLRQRRVETPRAPPAARGRTACCSDQRTPLERHASHPGTQPPRHPGTQPVQPPSRPPTRPPTPLAPPLLQVHDHPGSFESFAGQLRGQVNAAVAAHAAAAPGSAPVTALQSVCVSARCCCARLHPAAACCQCCAAVGASCPAEPFAAVFEPACLPSSARRCAAASTC